MDKLILLSVRDLKADYFLPPFTMRNSQEALRAFSDLVVKPGSTIHDHPEDFVLVRLGEFDCLTGQITLEQIINLAKGTDYVSAN